MSKARGRKRRKARRKQPPKPRAVAPAARPLSPRRRQVVVAAGLALLTVGVYLNTLDNPFVFDDHRTVVNNLSIRNLSNFTYVLGYERFRPLVNLSYALDYAVWQHDPAGYHLTNLALHVISVLLLYLFLLRLPGPVPRDEEGTDHDGLAALAAGLFAVHPVMTEAVGYVSGRSELLCGSFFFGALLCFQRWFAGRRWTWLLSGVLLWLLALGSKEIGAMLPAVLLAYVLVLLPPALRTERRRYLWASVALLGLVVAAGGVRVATYATQCEVIWRYLRLLLLPVGQSLTHRVLEGEVARLVIPRLVAGAALLGLLVLTWRLRARWPLLAFGWLWFLLLLVPSTLIPLGEPMAEHRLYVAACGVFVVASSGLVWLAGWLGRRLAAGRRAAVGAGLLLLALLAGATVARNRVWDDPVTLWSDAIAKAPGVYAPLRSLADAYRMQGDNEHAARFYRKALEVLPDDADARNLLGICLVQLSRRQEAWREFQRVLQTDPNNVQTHENLGMLAILLGRVEDSRRHLQRVLELDPGNRLARDGLATLDGKPRPAR
jgi:hypothetical protein